MINKYLVVFNPIAGKGAAIRGLPRIQAFFESEKLPYELIHTERVGHATEIARNYGGRQGVAVVAAGGDGTCNEVINGLLAGRRENDPPRLLGVLPLGRGNDFSFGGRIPARLDEALEVLALGKRSLLDAGIIKGGFYPEGRYFGNGIGVGFDTIVGLRAARMPHVQDALAYVLGALHTLVSFPVPPLVEIGMNGGKRVVMAMQISLMNGNRMGGLFYMAPEAVNNDGLLDMCLVEKIPRWRMLMTVVHYTKGTQGRCKGVTMDRAPAFTLKAIKGGMAVHADGETICTDGKELAIECVPGALEILHR